MTRVPMAVYAGNGEGRPRAALNGRRPNPGPNLSLLAANLIQLSAGMDLAQGLGWNESTGVATTEHLQFSWFIGAMAGALLAAPLIPHVPTRFYMIFAALCVTISGIVYVSAPLDYASIVGARYLNGVAAGSSLVAYIVHSSEICYCKQRGFELGLAQFCLVLGIAIQIICDSQWTSEFPLNRLHGILGLIFGLSAAGCAALLIESPIYYIRSNMQADALKCQQRLRGVATVDEETRFALEDNKNYVLENENRSLAECLSEGALPAMKLLLCRCFVAFSCSLPLSRGLQLSSYVALGSAHSWPPIVFAVLRCVFSLLGAYLLDVIGRKLVPMASLFVVAALSISLGGLYDSQAVLSSYQMAIACTLLLILQMFAGLFAPSSICYLGEAFPMRLKPYFIATCICFEQLTHLIVICTFQPLTHSLFVYLLSVGVIMLVFSLSFFALLPETRGTTLREAQDRFRRLYDLRLY